MAEPSVSLIMLTYNQSAYVAGAVESALAQEGAPIEIVITDDCSRDDTFAIIEKTVAGYAGPHKVIVNRNPEKLGLAGNIDMAHRLSSGDILIAAAGDDMSLPQRANRIRAAFGTHQPSLLCSYADVIGPDGAPIAALFVVGLWVLMVFAPGTPLVDEAACEGIPAADCSIHTELRPLYQSLVAGFFLLFLLTGWAYGRAAGTIKDHRDLVNMMAESMKDMGYYLVLAFAAAHFVAMFGWRKKC